jgi:anti-sigma regulatory factor (Ser/Thr protein kinase)
VIEHVIEEVRQGVHGHQRHDLHDVRIRVSDIADGFQIGVADLAASLDDLARKLDGGIPLRVGGMALPLKDRVARTLAGSRRPPPTSVIATGLDRA